MPCFVSNISSPSFWTQKSYSLTVLHTDKKSYSIFGLPHNFISINLNRLNQSIFGFLKRKLFDMKYDRGKGFFLQKFDSIRFD